MRRPLLTPDTVERGADVVAGQSLHAAWRTSIGWIKWAQQDDLRLLCWQKDTTCHVLEGSVANNNEDPYVVSNCPFRAGACQLGALAPYRAQYNIHAYMSPTLDVSVSAKLRPRCATLLGDFAGPVQAATRRACDNPLAARQRRRQGYWKNLSTAMYEAFRYLDFWTISAIRSRLSQLDHIHAYAMYHTCLSAVLQFGATTRPELLFLRAEQSFRGPPFSRNDDPGRDSVQALSHV